MKTNNDTTTTTTNNNHHHIDNDNNNAFQIGVLSPPAPPWANRNVVAPQTDSE